MKIYLDLVIIINFIYDFLIISSTSILLKRNIPYYRAVLSCLVGLISIISLFIPMEKIILITFKILLSISMVLIAFGKDNFLENIFYFYIMTIILGGSNYLFNNNLITIIFFIILSPLILALYIKSNREYKLKMSCTYDVILVSGKNTIKLNGFLDTGNKLIDPITKMPVIMISEELEYMSNKIFYVPYRVVNNEGVLKCISVDKVIIDNKVQKVLLGLCDKKIFKNNIGVILNDNLREMI